jgi:hypothetical protein
MLRARDVLSHGVYAGPVLRRAVRRDKICTEDRHGEKAVVASTGVWVSGPVSTPPGPADARTADNASEAQAETGVRGGSDDACEETDALDVGRPCTSL